MLEAQLCPTPCNPMDCNPPGSSLHGILHARIPEWPGPPCLPWCPGLYPTHPGMALAHLSRVRIASALVLCLQETLGTLKLLLGLTEEVALVLWSPIIEVEIEAQRISVDQHAWKLTASNTKEALTSPLNFNHQ